MTGVVLLAAEQLPIIQLRIELRIAQAIDKASSRIWGNVDGLEDSFVDRGPRPTSSSLQDLEKHKLRHTDRSGSALACIRKTNVITET